MTVEATLAPEARVALITYVKSLGGQLLTADGAAGDVLAMIKAMRRAGGDRHLPALDNQARRAF